MWSNLQETPNSITFTEEILNGKLYFLCSDFLIQFVPWEICTAWKPYFPVFGLNTEIYFVNFSIQSEYRKIRTRNNSIFGHFSRSDCKNNLWKQCFKKSLDWYGDLWTVLTLKKCLFNVSNRDTWARSTDVVIICLLLILKSYLLKSWRCRVKESPATNSNKP